MSDRERLLPPRRKNWTRGQPQIGVFLRTPTGGSIEMVNDKASPDEVAFVSLLIRGLRHVPQELLTAVRSESDRKLKEPDR